MAINDMGIESETYFALGLYETSESNSETSPKFLSLISSVLEKSIQKNEKLLESSKKQDEITVFHGSSAPSLSVRQYIERVFRYAGCSNSCFVVAYVYINRFLARKSVYLTSLNVHRLLITSVMVAAKFLDDENRNNAYYAKVGGVTTEEMNRMEMKFLFDIDFRLHVTTKVFKNYCLQLSKKGEGDYLMDREINIRNSRERWLNQNETAPKVEGNSCQTI